MSAPVSAELTYDDYGLSLQAACLIGRAKIAGGTIKAGHGRGKPTERKSPAAQASNAATLLTGGRASPLPREFISIATDRRTIYRMFTVRRHKLNR
jgi:hypothetical protein